MYSQQVSTTNYQRRVRKNAGEFATAWFKYMERFHQGQRPSKTDMAWWAAQLVEVTGRSPMDVGATLSAITRRQTGQHDSLAGFVGAVTDDVDEAFKL